MNDYYFDRWNPSPDEANALARELVIGSSDVDRDCWSQISRSFHQPAFSAENDESLEEQVKIIISDTTGKRLGEVSVPSSAILETLQNLVEDYSHDIMVEIEVPKRQFNWGGLWHILPESDSRPYKHIMRKLIMRMTEIGGIGHGSRAAIKKNPESKILR